MIKINNIFISFLTITLSTIFNILYGWTPFVIYCLITAIVYMYWSVPKVIINNHYYETKKNENR